MNATARTARRTVKARRAEAAAVKRPHTMTSHALRAGVPAADAAGIGNAIRGKAKLLGVTGCPARMFRRRNDGVKLWREPVHNAHRYTREDVAVLITGYNPRVGKYAVAKQLLLAYTAA